jgi:hypothetical protein
MEIQDSVELVAGVSVIVVTPALVEIAKANGLPVRVAGIASILIAFALLVTAEIAMNGLPPAHDVVRVVARWVLAGIVYGMAAAGLYSQGRLLGGRAVHQ